MNTSLADDDSAMNAAPMDDNLPVPLQLQVDELCLRFEAELQAEQRPQIEQFIDGIDASLRSKLLKELLLIEFEFQDQSGEHIELVGFLKRLPADDALVQSAYAEHVKRSASRVQETEARAGNSDLPPQAAKTDSAGSGSGLSDSSHHGRFLPGTKVADRYRIVSLLGKGGMGEVYRADDLKLGQTVALKFLPNQLAQDEKRLEYFHEEVRLTRQISHPNVCRVYDIGEVDGHYFLSMEYIDGEDLKALLRRIGRVPTDKGVQIAQQLCAGLAAAHEKGVLHRDLKPANIMIDGRGQVRITDFGLAKLASQGQRGEVVGTPAYMAPEQLLRGETTTRSDLYSLGLILYEMFTGKAVNKSGSIQELLQQQEDSSPSKPSRIVEDLEPIVERVILRCLKREAHERPASALAVAAALPGGDVLAAALAAGETPSPEMLVAAGDNRLMNTKMALCLFLVILAAIAVAGLRSQFGFEYRNVINLPLEPAVLEHRCRDYLQQLGYEKTFRDSVSGFVPVRARSKDASSDSDQAVPSSTIRFWYRASQDVIRPVHRHIQIVPAHEWDPPRTTGEQAGMRLDREGRLTDFWAVHRNDASGENVGESVDESAWQTLLSLMADGAALHEAAVSGGAPFVPVNERKSWAGSLPDGSPIRVDAGGYQGKLVWAQATALPANQVWVDPFQEYQEYQDGSGAGGILTSGIFYFVLVLAGTFAWRNVRQGRINHTGVTRIALLAIVVHQLWWLVGISRVPDVWEGLSAELFLTLGTSLVHGALVAIVFLALEPYVRRWWPDSIVGWTRLLSKGFNDPIVARDVLVGLAGGAILLTARSLGGDTSDPFLRVPPLDIREQLAGALLSLYMGCMLSFVLVLLVVVSKVTTGRRWPGVITIVGLSCAPMAFGEQPPAPIIMFSIMFAGAIMLELLRWGALPVAVTFTALNFPQMVGEQLSHWTNRPFLFGLVVVVLLAAFSFYRSLAGRPVFGPPSDTSNPGAIQIS